MKTKLLTNKKRASVLAVCIALIFAMIAIAPTLNAYAEYLGQSQGMTREQLHSATMATAVTDDAPAITVLMHGLGGNARDWSNDFNGINGSGAYFADDANSIIEKMRVAASGINLYMAKASNASSFKLYSEYGGTEVLSITANTLHDFTKHTVIVVHITTTWMAMKDVYEPLHYIIDKISYDFYRENNCLPRINLIGHSMGGLLNMQYAIDHPKNVASLVSLGTPYNGSWYDNWFVNLFMDDFKDQPCITGACGHGYYFCNLETRRNTWNSVYAQNPHINFHALSGETSLSIMNHIVLDGNYLEVYLGETMAERTRQLFRSAVPLQLVGGLLPGDVCVDTDSQKAVGYNGAINYNKNFSFFNSNVNKRSRDHLPIPHNLETYDRDMHNYILRVIEYGSTMQYQSYTQNGMTASIIDKSGDTWMILLTNHTGKAHNFYYNQKMCSEGDAQSWNGLGHIESTTNLAENASTTIAIQELLMATSITISYTSGSTRHIFYANNLDSSSNTMLSSGTTKSHYSYSWYSIEISIVSKYFNTWTLQLTNNTGRTRSFDYNKKMCFEDDAKNWNGLTDVVTTENLAHGTSTTIRIQEFGAATCIAISDKYGSTRNIHYIKNLSTSGTMTSLRSSRIYYIYEQHGIRASIVGKNNTTWIIELANYTESSRTFEYNQKMCFEGDAQNWKGLTSITTTFTLALEESTLLYIQENGTATSIAISYIDGSTRKIHYARNLSTSGPMYSYGSTAPTHSSDQYGMDVGIVGKNGNTWQIKLINNTGTKRSFEYNSKMCFEGDAKNWKGLSNVATTTSLDMGASTQLYIQENGTATSIAISYMDGANRKVFYAKNLKASGTMTAMGNTVEPPASGDSCVAEGTLITLSDGSQKAVEDLTGDEMLLVWNMQTGTFDSAPILFIDSDPQQTYEVIKLYFHDGSVIDVISEHGFWDLTLDEYVYLDDNAADYIGHWFSKQDTKNNDNVVSRKTKLIKVEIVNKVTTAYSPVTYGHLCYYVNGMLSMPGGITGLINILEINPKTMTYDQEALQSDIETYGLFTYEEFAEILPVSEEIFNAFNGQYLKIAIGKGLTDFDSLSALVQRYAEYF